MAVIQANRRAAPAWPSSRGLALPLRSFLDLPQSSRTGALASGLKGHFSTERRMYEGHTVVEKLARTRSSSEVGIVQTRTSAEEIFVRIIPECEIFGTCHCVPY
jgi:hypothetical protein